ncbi:lipoprotein-releasing system ATP-binding protein LolD [Candidatus Roizmanbacteria bacterium CG09_land_8_20_14_0_10_41_9]|uniref:Lipoprotein-releasing system ATP-binding protein LolD n=1 Tax=Candidatus Roizmanbacteria bacterium CG09_land_8_20_14_0_10_41_9 TaxID=1974850 RepID=A0A2H0WTL2_9BACT|nr:MAG: lipoprotein-releasing system ATP-binding protein LolD [Candidatus Roizmanbacteria bacterium CG09_land_8_20_14_0_10_41_9]
MIKLQGVWKEYQIDREITFTALKDITLTIEKGEFIGVVGPSGCGKSTLMYVMGLLDQPTKGSIHVDEKNVTGLGDDKISALRNAFFGFVFQQFNLINKLTVLENILLPSVYASVKLSYDPLEKARDLVDKFGLKGKENSYPNKISGGQQQRVAIARALIMHPECILADEPTGNLDSKTGESILDLLSELNREEKITIVVVTHDAHVAERTRRTIKMVDGQIV